MVEQPSPNRTDKSNGIKISVVDVSKNVIPPEPVKESDKDAKKTTTGNTPQPYFTMFVAEVIGTGLLMFLGCMGCINTYDEAAISHHFGGITFGLTVMLIIQTFGHISGAHLNPAVTIATVLYGILKPLMAVIYVLGQFAGATLGYGLLKILVPEKYAPDGFCITSLNENVTVIQGLAIEVVITTVLVLICCAVWDKRNEAKADSVPLRFGFAIAAISMSAGPLTGASMNTARSFAPLVFGGSWQDHWIYWVGPNLAAFVGCSIYRFLFKDPKENESKRESIYLNDVAHSAEKV
ncbi:hypothetical protein Zmor_014121 [Zophobas morio]|uniref:Aquaporin n=1 Tax=Zophobas morio TaxID=2755281 RepID=A0AA38IIY7_9CUCU|nr:hypothetical protein Zmor_014121 [Zophobas morio]